MSDPGLAWNFDPAQAEMIESIMATMVDQADALDPWWRALGRAMIDATTRTVSLGFLTLLIAALAYLLASRRFRDLYLPLAIWVIPEWVSAVTTWIAVLSLVVQEYAMLGSYISGMRSGMDAVAPCFSSMDCMSGDLLVDQHPEPVYTSHGCVGTALLATDVLLQEGVAWALVLFYILPEQIQAKLLRGVVVAPFLAACVSAAVNVQKVCWPGDIILDDGTHIERDWDVSDPQEIDPTTAKLMQVSHNVVLVVFALWIWKHRHAYLAQLSGTSEFGYEWIRPLLIIYAVPPAVNTGLSYIHATYGEGSDSSIWVYVLLSAAHSIIPSLMGMWPGLVVIIHRLRMPETVLPVRREKEDVAAGSSLPSLHPSDAAVDHSVAVEHAATVAGDSQLSERSPGI